MSGASRWRLVANYAGLLGVLVLLSALFGTQSATFLRLRTFATIANSTPDLLVVAVGMTLVLIAGEIDLSVGSVMALGASVMGLAMARWDWPLWAGAVLCLMVGAACGAVNGLITVAWRLPSFIVTLGMLEMARGGAYLVTDSQTMYLGARVEVVGAPLAGLGISPAAIAALVLVAVAQFVLSGTVFGRRLVAVGSNQEAAPNGAIGLELAAIAAAVIGGTSLTGGRGSVVGTFLGALIMAVLQTGLSQVGASEPRKRVITGAVIVLAVILDAYRAHRGGRLGLLLARWGRRK